MALEMFPMDKVKYAEMLPHEIVARRRKCPVAFIGLGGLEWHGEHLAVGNDALKAEKLCELAAARSGGFAFPTLWYGEPRNVRLMDAGDGDGPTLRKKMGFKDRKFRPGHYGKSDEQQVAFHQELLYHVLVQAETLEMRAVCLLCGHYPIRDFARPVVRRFGRDFPHVRAFAGTEVDYATPRDVAGEVVGGDHAGKWETSYLMALRPDCVDLTVFHGREKETACGVCGDDPRTGASVALGRRAVDRIVAGMVRKARRLLRQAGKSR